MARGTAGNLTARLRQRNRAGWPIALLAGALLGLGAACGDAQRTITLGVPTTVQDSGLFDVIRSAFRRAYPEYRLRVVAGGSGELLSLGARGDLDVMITHSPAAERAFMEAGHGLSHRPVMENDFVLVGPPGDPAGIDGLEDPAAALARIAADALFVSRGDDSGTHRKELELWSEIPAAPGGEGYREVGDGMGAVLRAASEAGAYTLTDRGTYLNLRSTLRLEIMVQGDPSLRNLYSVTVVAGAQELEGAGAFADWLRSPQARSAIAGYGRQRFGRSLFRPVTS